MSSTASDIDPFFCQAWHPGYRFRPRLSGFRRWGTALLFIALLIVIGGYIYIANSSRVKAMAEAYLSEFLGGRVVVEHASLSIFEGLRLDNVSVYVDASSQSKAEDNLVFRAASFQIKYRPASLLSGELKATEIMAIEPTVYLWEDVETGRWNFHRIIEGRSAANSSSQPTMVSLPEMSLRNGSIVYRQLRQGRQIPDSGGSMSVDGTLVPTPSDRMAYSFRLQSRGQSEMGPVITGVYHTRTGDLRASLKDFEFSRDIRVMLPKQVRQWWKDHQLAGWVDIPQFAIVPGREGRPASWNIEMNLENVTLVAWPEEWLTGAEGSRLAVMHDAFDLMRLAGLNQRNGALKEWDAGVHAALLPQPAGGAAAAADVAHGHRATHADSELGRGFVDCLETTFKPCLPLGNVSGQFSFSPQKLQIRNLQGRLEGNPFNVKGWVQGSADGYTAQSAASFRIEAGNFNVPEVPHWVGSMPRTIRELFLHVRPHGRGNFWATIDRKTPGEEPVFRGEVTVLDGGICLDKFAYPLRGLTGTVAFGPDDSHPGQDRCDIKNLRGLGPVGGPNENVNISIDCVFAPLMSDGGMDLTLQAVGLSSEPAIFGALSPLVRDALHAFDAPGKGELPVLRGNVVAHVVRPPGPFMPWATNVALDIRDGRAAFHGFPYPVENVHGKLDIADDHVYVNHVTFRPGRWGGNTGNPAGENSMSLDGRVTWGRGKRMEPVLTITADHLPIDRQLLEALPDEVRPKIEQLGATGVLDVKGKLFRRDLPATQPAAAELTSANPAGSTSGGVSSLPAAAMGYDLDIAVKDAAIDPIGKKYPLTDVSGRMRVINDHLTLSDFQGRHGKACFRGQAEMDGLGKTAGVSVKASASELPLDTPLYNLLPTAGKSAWDMVHAQGVVDAEISYRDGDVVATTVPATAPSPSYHLVIRPRNGVASLDAMPYHLEQLNGAIIVDNGQVALEDLTARHGSAKLALSGTGTFSADPQARPQWQLRLAAQDVPVDDDLRTALHGSFAKVLDTLGVQGTVNVDFSKIDYRGAASMAASCTAPAATMAALASTRQGSATRGARPATLCAKGNPAEADLDLVGQIALSNGTLKSAIPLTQLSGTLAMDVGIRGGKLARFRGNLNVPSFRLADRPVKNLRTELIKPDEIDGIRFDKLRAEVAGGEVAGQVETAFPENGPERYRLALVVRGADVCKLTGDTSGKIHGQVSASLRLEGAWKDQQTQRGGGDVLVEGRELYQIPLVMGLLQITNLSLPITSPFSQANARYSVEGQKVTFEQIELRSANMLMQGDGYLNYGTHKVYMTFVTDNPTWPKLPLVSELLATAKNELFQIHVSGTVQEPKVSASPFHTFSTTIDEVTKGTSSMSGRKRGN